MMEFYIDGQTIRFTSPVIAANSRDYLTARFHFSGEEWEGCSKWAHFRQGETVYDLSLENDEISSGMKLFPDKPKCLNTRSMTKAIRTM